MEYIDQLQRQRGENHVVTIVLPEFIPARWWQQLLHNQTALLIKGAAALPQERRRHRRPVSPEALTGLGRASGTLDGRVTRR